jgi:hypothetical protein
MAFSRGISWYEKLITIFITRILSRQCPEPIKSQADMTKSQSIKPTKIECDTKDREEKTKTETKTYE